MYLRLAIAIMQLMQYCASGYTKRSIMIRRTISPTTRYIRSTNKLITGPCNQNNYRLALFHSFPKNELILPSRTTGNSSDSVKNINDGTTQSIALPIRHVVAPMVAASDFAFRCLCRQYNSNSNPYIVSDSTGYIDSNGSTGPLLTFSQMLHAQNLVRDKSFVANHYDFYEYLDNSQRQEYLSDKSNLLPAQKRVLQGTSETEQVVPSSLVKFTEGPVIVQLAGHNVKTVVHAAQILYEKSDGRMDGIDLNCGCPQGIARKGQYGAFLMESDNAKTVCEILSALRKALPPHVSVSTKIRLPASEYKSNDIRANDAILTDRLLRLVDTGIDFLTVHGRTLHENKVTVGPCHWDRIQKAVNIVNTLPRADGSFMPIISNGGIATVSDIKHAFDATRASAVMSSEALLEHPDVFSFDTTTLSPRSQLRHQLDVARDYLTWCRYAPPLPGTLGHDSGSFSVVQGHLFKFLHRYLQEHGDLRDMLIDPKLCSLSGASQLLDRIESRYSALSDDDLDNLSSSKQESAWYYRHRKEKKDIKSNEISIEERKRLVMLRIEKLKSIRKEKQKIAV